MLTNRPRLGNDTGVPVTSIDLGPKLSGRTAATVVLGAPVTLARLWSALSRQRPFDVAVLHYKKEQMLTALLPPRATGPMVWVEWGPLPRQVRSGPGGLVYRLAARRARRIVAVTEATRASLIEAGIPATKVVVVPNFVDTESLRFDPVARDRVRAEWGASDDTFVIACVSRLHPKKQLRTVLRAVELMDGDVVLTLAGEGPDEANLRALADGIRQRVIFMPTPRGHVHEILSASDVQVFAPSETEASPPRAVLFGQLVARPVIATGPEGVGSVISPGVGAIADPADDPHVLARLLNDYRLDPARRRSEGAEAARRARGRFDAGAVGERVLHILEEVAS
jgi:glycosyltransferase involved in cell wall biosynthesis